MAIQAQKLLAMTPMPPANPPLFRAGGLFCQETDSDCATFGVLTKFPSHRYNSLQNILSNLACRRKNWVKFARQDENCLAKRNSSYGNSVTNDGIVTASH
jgi:hypothetical protein